MKQFVGVAAALLAAACARETTSDPADQFMARLAFHCGNAYEGGLVSSDDADADLAGEPMVVHFRECDAGEIRAPFHIGENRSRTWIITRTENGLRLKHDHRHEDGSEDTVTQYGGDSAEAVSPTRVEFPVDQFSIDLFNREGLTASVTNVWAMELTDEIFAYELARENRFFRVEFDVTKPVALPPPPWGAEE